MTNKKFVYLIFLSILFSITTFPNLKPMHTKTDNAIPMDIDKQPSEKTIKKQIAKIVKTMEIIPDDKKEEITNYFLRFSNFNLYKLEITNETLNNNFEKILEINRIKPIKKISLGYNQLTTIPNGISKLTKLEYLYLNKNNIEFIPTNIGDLTNLQILDLEENPRLHELPESTKNLIRLRRLFLPENISESVILSCFIKNKINKNILPNCKFEYPEGYKRTANISLLLGDIKTDKTNQEALWYCFKYCIIFNILFIASEPTVKVSIKDKLTLNQLSTGVTQYNQSFG